MSSFRQSISEGDGISVIPVAGTKPATVAALAQEVGAEAVAVARLEDLEAAVGETSLPVLLLESLSDPEGLAQAGALGACLVVAYRELAEDRALLELLAAFEGAVDFAVQVRDEEELHDSLEQIDPDILLLAVAEEDGLEQTLMLLSDIPVGKLVIASLNSLDREQLAELERAGVDAVLVRDTSLLV